MFLAFCFLFLGILSTISPNPNPSPNGLASLIRYQWYFRHQSHSNRVYRARDTTQRKPTLYPAKNFNATSDAQTLNNAMDGIGTHEVTIVNILTRRSNGQRVEIAEQYRRMFGRTLRNALISELSFKFMDTMLALIEPTNMFYAIELNKALRGWGTNDDALIEIICTLISNNQLKAVSAVYAENYGPLVEDIKADTSGDFRDFLVSLLEETRDATNVTDLQQAKIDAQALYDAGVDKWGTDEQVFYTIFATRNFNQLRVIFDEYKNIAYHRIDHAIEEEFSGDVKEALLTFVNVIRNVPAYFATRLYDSMVHLGTKDHTLIRIIVTRCEVDLGDIEEEYYTIYGKELGEDILNDTLREYRRSLLRLLGYWQFHRYSNNVYLK